MPGDSQHHGHSRVPQYDGPGAHQVPEPSAMHPAYFEVAFDVPHPPEVWPQEFGIITAWTPTGQQRTPEQNQQADELLATTLKSLIGPHLVRITGYSPTTGHTEPGWMAPAPLEIIRALGHQFDQDAVYWVERDHLFVTKCNPDFSDLVSVGHFRERVHPQ